MRLRPYQSVFALLILTSLCLPSWSQTTQQLPTGGALGYHEFQGQLSRPLALNDTTMVVARPSAFAYKDRTTSGLVVYTNLLGIRESTFIHLPGVFQSFAAIWAEPFKLDDETVIMPYHGPDGFYGTTDDELVMITNLKTPGLPTTHRLPLGRGGIKPGQRLAVLGPRTVAYINAFRDSHSVAGDQQLTVVHDIGGPAEHVQVIDLTATSAGGTDGHMVAMGTGKVGMVFCGNDFIWGTMDDVIGVLRLEQGIHNAVLDLVLLKQSLRLPVSGKFPVWTGGDELLVFGDGFEQSPGDDVELRVSGFANKATIAISSLANAGRFQGTLAASDSIIDASGVALRLVSGPDDMTGTFDDQILIRVRDTFEVLALNAKLAPEAGDPLADPVAMSCGVTLVPMFGRQGFGAGDAGIFVVSGPQASGAPRTATVIPVFDNIVKIVPMTDSSAMLYADSGTGYYVDSLDTAFPGLTVLPGVDWDGTSDPVVINPAMVAFTAPGTPDPSFQVSDEVILHKISAVWNFGAATANSQNHELKAGCSRRALHVGFPTFDVTLEGAPANQVSALFISLHRETVMVAPGASFLLSPETLFFADYTVTDSVGSSSKTLPTPNDGSWYGYAAQYQWFVVNPASTRGFELSDGLTVSM